MFSRDITSASTLYASTCTLKNWMDSQFLVVRFGHSEMIAVIHLWFLTTVKLACACLCMWKCLKFRYGVFVSAGKHWSTCHPYPWVCPVESDPSSSVVTSLRRWRLSSRSSPGSAPLPYLNLFHFHWNFRQWCVPSVLLGLTLPSMPLSRRGPDPPGWLLLFITGLLWAFPSALSSNTQNTWECDHCWKT